MDLFEVISSPLVQDENLAPGLLIGNFFFISGITAFDDGTTSSNMDIQKQTEVILKKIKALLLEKQCDYTNIAKLTIYLTNIQDAKEVKRFIHEFTNEKMSITCVGVTALENSANIEIEGLAIYVPKEPPVQSSGCGGCKGCHR